MSINKEQAHYLLTNEAFIALVEAERADALETLATADADDLTEILRQQQRVSVIDNLQFEIIRLSQTVDEAP